MAPDPQDNAREFGRGWIPDNYDHNDKLLGDLYGMQRLPLNEVFQAIAEKAEKRTKFTLEYSCLPVYNQLALGSCVVNATAAALRFAWKNSFLHYSTPYEEFDPSRLWIYYYARLTAHTRQDLAFRDTGCSIRNALRVLQKKGVCTEKAWPYLNEAESKKLAKLQKDTKDEDAMPPDCPAGIVPDTANDANVKDFFDFGFDYHRIRSLTDDQNKSRKCRHGHQANEAGGSNAKSEFFDASNWTGDVFNVQIDKLGSRGEDDGGHAVLCVGFDSGRKLFRVMNSWGAGRRDSPFFWMPFSWFEQAGTIEVQVQGKPGQRTIRPA